MKVERLLAKLFRKDQFVYVDLFGAVLLEIAKENQQECQTGEALLAVHDITGTVFFADDDRPQEIMRVVSNFVSRMGGIILLKEFIAEVVNQFVNLFLVPLVFTLVVIN